MHSDHIIPALSGILIVVLVLAILLRRMRQPVVVAFILTGVLIGPSGFGFITDLTLMNDLGSLGIVLLLFFVGMEIDLSALLARWKNAVGGTVLQVLASVAAVAVFGQAFGWSFNRMLLLGFVVSISSTAVVLQILRDDEEQKTRVGETVTGILIVQDLAIIPMLLVLGLLGDSTPGAVELTLQGLGLVTLILSIVWVIQHQRLPSLVMRIAREDEDSRFLVSLLLCFGLAFFAGLVGLSTALGAFAAGIMVRAARQTEWIHRNLEPFRVIFVGAFFVSIGMLIDLTFIRDEWLTVTLLVVVVMVSNTTINAFVFRSLGEPWRESVYSAALLAQVGELSFLLAAVGRSNGMISDFGYQATVSSIAITLTLSPAWILLFQGLTGYVTPATRRKQAQARPSPDSPAGSIGPPPPRRRSA